MLDFGSRFPAGFGLQILIQITNQIAVNTTLHFNNLFFNLTMMLSTQGLVYEIWPTYHLAFRCECEK
ncbi:hypothetical protein GDO81_008137 [Engystomops pustulosus]|uniref:Uncharacterized protein n=1 Tax=Engystomops pustulosus TaxID=76066 RepID=A0AAV7CDD0_ENGPU|nr:hypothetical protein GDO81_008137 [Engystomops pustulosus]